MKAKNKFVEGSQVICSLSKEPYLTVDSFVWNGYTYMYSFKGTDLRCGEHYLIQYKHK
jgi:hypothetical protein